MLYGVNDNIKLSTIKLSIHIVPMHGGDQPKCMFLRMFAYVRGSTDNTLMQKPIISLYWHSN